MPDVYVYYTELPDGINEVVTPCLCGYTIYLNQNLTKEAMEEAYNHAMFHILNDDFSKHDVNEIEKKAHNA